MITTLMRMRLAVLGPVQCTVDGTAIEVRGSRNRALLAALAVDRDRVTGIDELVDALWGVEPPGAAEKVVRNRVSLLRSVLTPGFVDTVRAGYRLGTSVTVDAQEFEDVPGSAAGRLAVWRGRPFDEIIDWPPARAAAARLEELRARLEEVVVAEQLDAGVDSSSLVGRVEELVEREPFRERRWALLMRTLYLAGRRRDALHAFGRARVLLRDELGLSPGTELLSIERSILHGDPSLGPRMPPARSLNRLTPALFGRSEDAKAVRDLLRDRRLVTLAGLGGVGKTSLARELSMDWEDPHFLVDLTAADDQTGIDDAVVRGLRIASGHDASGTVAAWASNAAPCLLVFDNCEHVVDAVVRVADIVLAGGDGPTILATSRIPLRHPAEEVFHLQPLARHDAITLYHARADRRRQPASDDETAVDRLCQLLSDIPLAVELAAARSSILSPADMVGDLTTVTDSRAADADAGHGDFRPTHSRSSMSWGGPRAHSHPTRSGCSAAVRSSPPASRWKRPGR